MILIHCLSEHVFLSKSDDGRPPIDAIFHDLLKHSKQAGSVPFNAILFADLALTRSRIGIGLIEAIWQMLRVVCIVRLVHGRKEDSIHPRAELNLCQRWKLLLCDCEVTEQHTDSHIMRPDHTAKHCMGHELTAHPSAND